SSARAASKHSARLGSLLGGKWLLLSTPIVTPVRSGRSASTYRSTGRSAEDSSLGWYPAMICNITAQSRAERAMVPTWSRVYARGTQPDFGTRPNVGFRPVTPFHAAGSLMLPPVSVPIPASTSPAAIPLAVPALDPPADRSTSQGFRGIAKGFPGSG